MPAKPKLKPTKSGKVTFHGKAKRVPKNPHAILLPFQKKWVDDRAKIKGAEKSRQIGWTWADALDTTRQLALEHKESNAGSKLDTWITSRDDTQAQLYLQDCKKWAQFYQLGANVLGDVAETVIEWEDAQGKKQKCQAYKLPFASGGCAYSLSSNEDAQAGKRGTRKIDEAALHPRLRKLYGIAYPGIMWGGQLAFFSTHRGSGHFFNHLIKEIRENGNPKGINLHRVTFEDALDQGLLYKLQQKWPTDDPQQELDEQGFFDKVRAECADEETFQQEYMCVPSDDSSAFLSYELIDAAKYLPGMPWEIPDDELGSQIFMGVDIGRHSDLTVIWVLERLAGLWLTRKVVKLHKCEFELQHKIISDLIITMRVKRCCIDRSGLGEAPAERLQRRFRSIVEPIIFTPANKEILATPVRKLMEDRVLKIPDDPKTTAAMRKIRREPTTSDTWRFVADSTADGHADEFWALGLAIHAGQRPNEMHKPVRFNRASDARMDARQSRRLEG